MILTWDVLALLGITISFLIVTLIFMLSYMFQNEFLKSWSKEEFFNVFITLILFGSLFSLVKSSLFSDNVTSSKEYVNAVFDNVLNIQISIISDVSFLSLMSSLSFFINLNALQSMGKGGSEDASTAGTEGSAADATDSLSTSISLSPFISPFLTALTSLQVYSFVPITMIKLHSLLISFVQADASRTFPILLAAGLFLRSFKFSRNAGNTILALFISLYFILPILYLFNQGLVNTIMLDNKELTTGIYNNKGEGFVSNLMTVMMDEIKQVSASEVMSEDYDLDYDNNGKISFGEKVYHMLTPEGSIYDFIVRFMIEGLVLPYLAIIITLGLAREFAMTLGSNVDFSSMVRLV